MIETKKVLLEAKVEKDSTYCYCDNCKKLIGSMTPYINHRGIIDRKVERNIPNAFEIYKGHYEWGNDSIDSREELHACSDECLGALFLDYVEKYHKDYPSAYFEINEMRW